MYLEYKKCSVCGEVKPVTEFEKRDHHSFSYRCKACAAEYRRAVYNGNKTRIQLERRLAKLEKFCGEHNIDIKIKVNNDESTWN